MTETLDHAVIYINSRMERNSKIVAISLFILVGFLGSISYHYYEGHILGKPYPYNTFLFIQDGAVRFNDFFVSQLIGDLNPYFNSVVSSAQFPLVNIFYYLIALMPKYISLPLYLTIIPITLVSLTNLILWEGKKLSLRKWLLTLSITFLTYPFLFTLDRGNLEILLYMFLLLFLYFFIQENYLLSAIFLAFAVAMKVYPGVLFLLYVPKKRLRELAISIGITALLTFGSLALFKGGFIANFNFLVHGSNFSYKVLTSFVGPNNEVQRGVSLFTLFKIVFIETGWLAKINMAQFLSIYIKAAALSFIPVAAYVVFIEKILWRQTALLVFAMLLLPQISADYKLLHVYLPMFLFIISDDRSRLDVFYLLIFSLLLIPKDYAYFPHVLSDAGTNDISISVIINIILMLLISVLIIFSGLKDLILKWFKRLAQKKHEYKEKFIQKV